MSLIPSKRVDRIFPVIPPLCLLLAAQVGSYLSCSYASVSRSGIDVDSNLARHLPSPDHGEADGPVATESCATNIYRWTAVALIVSILFTGGYVTWKAIAGYRDRRDALAIFGRDVRREAEARHWRYEVVSAKDEGVLLYLQKTHYIQPDDAVAEWNAGNLDALVVSMEKATGLVPRLSGTVSRSRSSERKDEEGTGYVLILR